MNKRGRFGGFLPSHAFWDKEKYKEYIRRIGRKGKNSYFLIYRDNYGYRANALIKADNKKSAIKKLKRINKKFEVIKIRKK